MINKVLGIIISSVVAIIIMFMAYSYPYLFAYTIGFGLASILLILSFFIITYVVYGLFYIIGIIKEG